MVLPTFTSTGPSVHFTYLPASLLKFTPSSNTEALSPPVSDHTLARPFNIDQGLYNNALHVAVPVTIALVYATTVTYFNRANKDRNYKPWDFSKSLTFYALVVTHNVFLAVYSGWTFIGTLNAIRGSWPGWNGDNGLAGVADALCKMHGPRGIGSAATYNASSTGWGVTDRAIKLAQARPDTTDVGRLWNEGLAFYGWLFYLSKFYEVLDTAIILIKGKKSSNLQTFHHTGAMLCMWAGIRYMSPPIWMFVFINSGLHAVMYTYYTLAALTIQVPPAVKRILTTMQILQIVFGCSYALAHLFVAYDIPIEMPYLYAHNLSTALPSTASAVASTVSSALSSAATAGIASWLKKAALRAAGEEGLAENVRNSQGETFGIDAVHAADVGKAQEEIRYRMERQTVHCLDTSGEVFAILLNAIYLVPLAVLFFRFFYRSYVNRAHSEPPKPSQQENLKESSKDATKDITQEIREAMGNEQGGVTEPPADLKEKYEGAKDNIKDKASDLSEKAQSQAKDIGDKAKDAAGDLPGKVQKGVEDLSNKAKDAAGDLPARVQKGAEDLSNKAKDAAGDLPEKVQKGLKDGAAKAQDATGNIPAKAQEMGAQAKKVGTDYKQAIQDDLKALQEKMKNGEGPKPNRQETSKPTGESKNKESTKPNGDTKVRDPSPVKRNKSPTKVPTPRGISPTKREKSPVKAAKPAKEKPSEDKPSEVKPADGEPVDETPAEGKPAEGGPVDEKPAEGKPTENGPAGEAKAGPEEKKSSPDLGASGYEMVPDEPKTEEERKAEEEMQPKTE